MLIQSGFAILAIAKISAAKKRHPDIIVSLSIFPLQFLVLRYVYYEGGNAWRDQCIIDVERLNERLLDTS